MSRWGKPNMVSIAPMPWGMTIRVSLLSSADPLRSA
jgi:hypothetical protein